MVDLNNILSKVSYYNGNPPSNIYPIIQRSDGLFTTIDQIEPSTVDGTDLKMRYWVWHDGFSEPTYALVSGTWNTERYSYNVPRPYAWTRFPEPK